MPWSGIETERLQEATEEGEKPTTRSAFEEQAEEHGDVDMDVDKEMQDQNDGSGQDAGGQPLPKRRRLEEPQESGEQIGNGVQMQGNEAPVQPLNVNGNGNGNGKRNGNGNGEVQAQAAATPSEDKVPFFKSGLVDPDDKGENDCFFDSCVTRAGGNQYFVKHLMDKHGLIRGDQGRQEGGRRKTPKYLTLCPTNWPYIYGSTSSCRSCGDITGLLAVLGDRNHESPGICSFCWSYFPTRRDLVTHINQGPCKSNEMFSRKLLLIRHMYAESLRVPGAEQVSQAAADQRQAHTEAERAARHERWQLEAQLQQQAQEHLRQIQAQQAQQQQPHHESPPPRLQGQHHRPAPSHPAFPQLNPPPPPPLTPSRGGSVPPQQNPLHSSPLHSLPNNMGLLHTAVDYAVPSATAEAMVRTIERLSGVIADLAATNAQLVQDLRAKDQLVAARDQQVRARDDRILALSGENKRLAVEVARLGVLVERVQGGERFAEGSTLGSASGGRE
ncbi:hypothetical protein VTI74DRAFT_9254 [Chaetomium olivicolor]